ncbi:unnamed protein product [Parnassius apollo]|uniref:(apollo) hypothetical protein n=1 Tax=Parnassius apollo TaxID=110799 RepID=A0A8S3XRA6_PARAO|nr:unnamed protein product [Parnassius apollo]
MTSTNDGKNVKSNQTSGPKGKSFYIELYKSLDGRLNGEAELHDRVQHLCEAWRRIHSLCQHSAHTTHPHLLSWLQRHTARTILQTEWQSPESKTEHVKLSEAIEAFIKETQDAIASRDGTNPFWESQLQQRAEWFKNVLSNPWGHPVLRVLLDPTGETPSDKEVIEWLKEERGVIFVTRLRHLASSKKCLDLACALASAVMDRARASAAVTNDDAGDKKVKLEKKEPTFVEILKTEAGFTVDVWELLTDLEFVLLFKAENRARCIELAKQTPLRSGYQLVERLHSRLEMSPREKKLWKNAKEVATLIAQVIIARCMVVPVCSGSARTALYCCARSLARLLPAERLPAAASALAAPAATARHLHTLAAAVDAQARTHTHATARHLHTLAAAVDAQARNNRTPPRATCTRSPVPSMHRHARTHTHATARHLHTLAAAVDAQAPTHTHATARHLHTLAATFDAQARTHTHATARHLHTLAAAVDAQARTHTHATARHLHKLAAAVDAQARTHTCATARHLHTLAAAVDAQARTHTHATARHLHTLAAAVDAQARTHAHATARHLHTLAAAVDAQARTHTHATARHLLTLAAAVDAQARPPHACQAPGGIRCTGTYTHARHRAPPAQARRCRRCTGTYTRAPPRATCTRSPLPSMHRHCKDEMKPFVCELYVRAITSGMNELERLKLKTEKEADARAMEQTLSSWFTQLGTLLSKSVRLNYECALTAFSVHPTSVMYERIVSAPTLPSVAATTEVQESASEANPEFGSWATDSCTKTNFVKTSETLNIKQIQHNANVLSTAVLSEGEALGLGAELCQDLAVLLSGPRHKTLSWDIDRDVLLENCRTYMERTHGGTRALTTELKYLNLDPSSFMHLPEEQEDEDNIYYGIEKGYEHLVEYQEVENIWQDAFIDPEMGESANSISIFDIPVLQRRKKYSKRAQHYSDEDSDPLCVIAEEKRHEKKKERPHSKERSKERIKSKTKEPGQDRDGSSERNKVKSERKEQKKEKKERKKRDKLNISHMSETRIGSLSRLVGMKVTRVENVHPKIENQTSCDIIDYSSQRKLSVTSLNSDGSENNVVFDGLYSMDEIKSPEKVVQITESLSKTPLFNSTDLACVKDVSVNNNHKLDMDIANIQSSAISLIRNPITNITKTVTDNNCINDADSKDKDTKQVKENVKQNIKKLIQFRKLKCSNNEQNIKNEPNIPNEIQTLHSVKNYVVLQKSSKQKNVKEVCPTPTSVSSSLEANLNIPKIYMNKKQSEKLRVLKNEVSNVLVKNNKCNTSSSAHLNESCVGKVVAGLAQYTKSTSMKKLKTDNINTPLPVLQSESQNLNVTSTNNIVLDHSKRGETRILVKNMPCNNSTNSRITNQSKFKDFLKELQETINAGAIRDKSEAILRLNQTSIAIKNSNSLNKTVPTNCDNLIMNSAVVTQCAKSLSQQKKVENAPNTFARLSYMHKNKQSDVRPKPAVCQAKQIHQQKQTSSELDQQIADFKLNKFQYLEAKGVTISRVGNPIKINNPKDAQDICKEKSRSNFAEGHPVLSKILQVNEKNASSKSKLDVTKELTRDIHNSRPQVITTETSKSSLLAEKDQDDLLLLLRQKNWLNASRSTTKPELKLNRTPQAITEMNLAFQNFVPNSKSLDLSSVKNMKLSECETHRDKFLKPPTSSITQNDQAKPSVIKIQTSSRTLIHSSSQSSYDNTTTSSILHNTLPETKCDSKESLVKKETTTPRNSYGNNTTKQDWESVMDAILKHKTPSRGPNALDIALNKDSFEKRLKESNLHNQKIVSNSSEKKDYDKVFEKDFELKHKKIVQISKPQQAKTFRNPLLKSVNVDLPKRLNKNVISKANIHHMPKVPKAPVLPKKDTSFEVLKNHDPFISGIPNSDYDLLEELMDDDLRKEIGELLSEDETYQSVALSIKKDNKHSLAIKSEPKTIAPFRKELGVQGIHEQSPVLTCDNICSNFTKDLGKPIDTISVKSAPKLSCTSTSNNDPHLKSQGMVNCELIKTTTSSHNSVIEPRKKIIYQPAQQENISQNNNVAPCNEIIKSRDSNILKITKPIAVNNNGESVRIPSPNNILISSQNSYEDSKNVIIATVPQRTTLQNVVLIGSEIVYDPYAAIQIQGSSNTSLCNINQNTYVAVNTMSNIALLHTTQFAAPVVTPVIIGNAVALSAPNDEAQQSLNTKSLLLNLRNHSESLSSVSTMERQKAKIDYTKSNFEKVVNENLFNDKKNHENKMEAITNKNNERKILSQVQTNQKLSPEKTDSRFSTKLGNLADLNVKVEVSKEHERLKQKRLAIISRRVSHHTNILPIPLPYTPLNKTKPKYGVLDAHGKVFKDNAKQIITEGETTSSSTIVELLKDDNLSNTGNANVQLKQIEHSDEDVSLHDRTEFKVPGNYKENDNKLKLPCRRIMLRSSKNVNDNIIMPCHKNTKIHKIKKIKRQVKSVSSILDSEKTSKEDIETNKVKSSSEGCKHFSNQNKNVKENTTIKEIVRRKSKEHDWNVLESPESRVKTDFFDVEDQLVGSVIHKISRDPDESPHDSTSISEIKSENEQKEKESNNNLNKVLRSATPKVNKISRHSAGLPSYDTSIVGKNSENEQKRKKPKNNLDKGKALKVVKPKINKTLKDCDGLPHNNTKSVVCETTSEQEGKESYSNKTLGLIIPIIKETSRDSDILSQDNTKIVQMKSELEQKGKESKNNIANTLEPDISKANRTLKGSVESKIKIKRNKRKEKEIKHNIGKAENLLVKSVDGKHMEVNDTNLGQKIENNKTCLKSDITASSSESYSYVIKNDKIVTKVNCKLKNNSRDIKQINSKDNFNVSITKQIPKDEMPNKLAQNNDLSEDCQKDLSKKFKERDNLQGLDNLDQVLFQEIINKHENEPYKKFFRVMLPNGKKFKATITGKNSFDVKNILKHPELKSILLNNYFKSNSCTLSVKKKGNTEDSKMTFKTTQVTTHETNSTKSVKEMETISLISDDEGELLTQHLKTEYGNFLIAPLDKNTFSKHQKKLSEKCSVLLTRNSIDQFDALESNCKIRETCGYSEERNHFLSPNSFKSDDINNEVPNAQTVPLSLSCKSVAEVVAEDSSDIVDKTSINSPLEDTIIKPNLNDIDSVLLKNDCIHDQTKREVFTTNELELNKNVKDMERTPLKDFLNPVKLLNESANNYECCLKITRCDNLVKKLKNINTECFVELTRCDDILKECPKRKTSHNVESTDDDSIKSYRPIKENTATNDFFNTDPTEIENNFVSESKLVRSGSFSILDDFSMYIENTDDLNAEPSIVKELSVIYIENENKFHKNVPVAFKCDADWFVTKNQLFYLHAMKYSTEFSDSDQDLHHSNIENFDDASTDCGSDTECSVVDICDLSTRQQFEFDKSLPAVFICDAEWLVTKRQLFLHVKYTDECLNTDRDYWHLHTENNVEVSMDFEGDSECSAVDIYEQSLNDIRNIEINKSLPMVLKCDSEWLATKRHLILHALKYSDECLNTDRGLRSSYTENNDDVSADFESDTEFSGVDMSKLSENEIQNKFILNKNLPMVFKCNAEWLATKQHLFLHAVKYSDKCLNTDQHLRHLQTASNCDVSTNFKSYTETSIVNLCELSTYQIENKNEVNISLPLVLKCNADWLATKRQIILHAGKYTASSSHTDQCVQHLHSSITMSTTTQRVVVDSFKTNQDINVCNSGSLENVEVMSLRKYMIKFFENNAVLDILKPTPQINKRVTQGKFNYLKRKLSPNENTSSINKISKIYSIESVQETSLVTKLPEYKLQVDTKDKVTNTESINKVDQLVKGNAKVEVVLNNFIDKNMCDDSKQKLTIGVKNDKNELALNSEISNVESMCSKTVFDTNDPSSTTTTYQQSIKCQDNCQNSSNELINISKVITKDDSIKGSYKVLDINSTNTSNIIGECMHKKILRKAYYSHVEDNNVPANYSEKLINCAETTKIVEESLINSDEIKQRVYKLSNIDTQQNATPSNNITNSSTATMIADNKDYCKKLESTIRVSHKCNELSINLKEDIGLSKKPKTLDKNVNDCLKLISHQCKEEQEKIFRDLRCSESVHDDFKGAKLIHHIRTLKTNETGNDISKKSVAEENISFAYGTEISQLCQNETTYVKMDHDYEIKNECNIIVKDEAVDECNPNNLYDISTENNSLIKIKDENDKSKQCMMEENISFAYATEISQLCQNETTCVEIDHYYEDKNEGNIIVNEEVVDECNLNNVYDISTYENNSLIKIKDKSFIQNDSTNDGNNQDYEILGNIENTNLIDKQIVNKGTNDAPRKVTLVYNGESEVVLKGIEYEDPIAGTCYMFPLETNTVFSEEVPDDDRILKGQQKEKQSINNEVNEALTSTDIINTESLYDENFSVLVPKMTYSKKDKLNKSARRNIEKVGRRGIKRKSDCLDCKMNEKRYRKSKIDYTKPRVSIHDTTYCKEYKRLFDYYSSLKFSYSRPFHKEYIDVFSMVKAWPIIQESYHVPSDSEIVDIFCDSAEQICFPDPMKQTLAEELSTEYLETHLQSNDMNETNFNMGFGEGSGRVKQEIEKDCPKFSAATLSDVKHSQPFLLSEDYEDCKNNSEISNISESTTRDQKEKLKRYITYIQLRDKVRSYFKKTSIELKYNWIKDNIKDKDFKWKCDGKYDFTNYPFDFLLRDFIEPPPLESIVQVVQVGQLPVSAAAQNPVSCDPRVTQVSDASPSQCSVENSPQDDSQSAVKTEYTELTTADLTLPLVAEYEQHDENIALESHEPTNLPIKEDNLQPEKEFISNTKIELKEVACDIEVNNKLNIENRELHVIVNKHVNDSDYHFETNNTGSLESDSRTTLLLESTNSQNSTSEKTDQIAHAMNAAGITTNAETNSRANALVNILSQKVHQSAITTTQSSMSNFSKTTSINAVALQQALAQILPPPLNQTNSSDNNQQAHNSTVTPQVLHIVQGKNATGNQITLVDNTQPSVINTPNATPVLHIVQNKNSTAGTNSNGSPVQHTNSFGGLSLVDTGLQQGGNQLLHIVNTGNQKNNNTSQLLKRVNLLTNLTNVQGSNEQKMVQFVCKSADGKAIQLNAPHQRGMVLRLQPIESTNVQTTPTKADDLSPTTNTTNIVSAKETTTIQQEIKSRSVYEENYAKFIQNTSNKQCSPEKSTSLPKFNQAFGKPVFQDGSQKQNEISNNNSHLSSVNSAADNPESETSDNAITLDHIGQISSPPLLLRKSSQTSQAQPTLVQQIKQTITPMNIQTMHGGVIYTRQIPVNIGGGQTINLITVPSTDLIDETNQKQSDVKFVNQGDIEPSIIKIVPQNQTTSNTDVSSEEGNNNNSGGISNDNGQNTQPPPQPVLTQMRIKLPMLSKTPQMVSGARVVRPSFFQIQRNVIGGANQPVYQQLVLTAAPPLGQQTIRLPQSHLNRQIKVPSETQSSSESQMSSSTLEQLREFDMVLEQVKERSTVQPNSNGNGPFSKLHTSPSDTTDGTGSPSTEPTQVLYSIGTNQHFNVAYVNRKPTVTTTPATSTFVRSPDSSTINESPSSSSHAQISQSTTTVTSPNGSAINQQNQHKPTKIGSKSKSRPKASSNPPNTLKLNNVPPKTSTQKPLEDEQTTQRILYILAEYKEQVENSPDKDKPAPRRRTNPPSNSSGSSKRKKSSSSSRRPGARDMSPIHGEETCRTMGSEDSSCGTSQGDCNESCLESHSPQDSPQKIVRKLTFENETPATQPRPQPQRNVIVADGQTITVARGTAGKPATAVLMPANYILPVSMVKGGQQIAIVTNRGPKLLTVGGGEGGTTNALLLQRLIGPAGLKPVLARPGVRHVRLPTAALHNLQTFNLTTAATTVQPPDSTASPAPAPTPELVETRATTSPWAEKEVQDVKPERGSSPEGSEPWNLPSSADPHDYSYEETVRADSIDRTVLVVQKKDGTSHRQHRLTHVSAAALRHKYAILEHELRLQKSLSEECEDLGVDSPSASELFPEAELLFAGSPAHDHTQDQNSHHSHTPQPTILSQSSIPQPDMDDQIATDQLLPRNDIQDDRNDLDVNLGLEDVGIVTVSEDGMQATIALDQEEFARSHPNTTFHSEPTDEGEVQPFTIAGFKGRHITSTIFHSNRAPATVLMTAPQTTVISQATPDNPNIQHNVKFSHIDNIISSAPSSHVNNLNLSSVLVKDDGLTRFDSILTDSRELHLSNTASAIVHSGNNATQVIRRVCYDDDKRDPRFLIDEPDTIIAGDDAKMIAEESSREATLESITGDVDDDRSSPERHAELFWESNSASERSESRRPLDFSSDSDKCCKSPSFDETNSTDSSGVGTHMRLDSVIKEARGKERSGSADGSSADDTHPPLRTYPAKRPYYSLEGEMERSLSGKTRAGERSPDSLEVRRRASGRGVVKRGCHCCNGSPVPPRPKKPRQRKPTMDFSTH